MFNNVLRCLVSHATISIGDRMAADRLRDRDNVAGIGDNSAEIVNNSAKIFDDAAGTVDIATKVIPC